MRIMLLSFPHRTEGIADPDPHAATAAAIEMLQALRTQTEVRSRRSL